MLDSDVKVIRQVEDSRYDRAGMRYPFIRIEFTVGPHGPFVERIDKDAYTAQARDDKLNTFAREVRTT